MGLNPITFQDYRDLKFSLWMLGFEQRSGDSQIQNLPLIQQNITNSLSLYTSQVNTAENLTTDFTPLHMYMIHQLPPHP